jgi:hypothetical protein
MGNFTEEELLTDLPPLIAFYGKLKSDLANKANLAVTPPVNPGDSADADLAVVQANMPAFVGLVRTIRLQVNSPAPAA